MRAVLSNLRARLYLFTHSRNLRHFGTLAHLHKTKPTFLWARIYMSFLSNIGRCRYLISRARGPLRPAFEACRGAVRAHAPMAQFLLTHLVADVLVFGDKEAANQVQWWCVEADRRVLCWMWAKPEKGGASAQLPFLASLVSGKMGGRGRALLLDARLSSPLPSSYRLLARSSLPSIILPQRFPWPILLAWSTSTLSSLTFPS